MSDRTPFLPPVGAGGIDPQTGQPWPLLMDTEVVQRFLQAVYGIVRARQTITHDRSLGIGPAWKYLGQKPVTTAAEVTRYVEEDLLTDTSPLSDRAQTRPRTTPKRRRVPQDVDPVAERAPKRRAQPRDV